jgi:hypothetical protein
LTRILQVLRLTSGITYVGVDGARLRVDDALPPGAYRRHDAVHGLGRTRTLSRCLDGPAGRSTSGSGRTPTHQISERVGMNSPSVSWIPADILPH